MLRVDTAPTMPHMVVAFGWNVMGCGDGRQRPKKLLIDICSNMNFNFTNNQC